MKHITTKHLISDIMNKYFLQEKLGSGGYSSVYKCVDHIGIRYACKVLPKANNKRHRIQQEVEMLMRLTHSTRVNRIIVPRSPLQGLYLSLVSTQKQKSKSKKYTRQWMLRTSWICEVSIVENRLPISAWLNV